MTTSAWRQKAENTHLKMRNAMDELHKTLNTQNVADAASNAIYLQVLCEEMVEGLQTEIDRRRTQAELLQDLYTDISS